MIALLVPPHRKARLRLKCDSPCHSALDSLLAECGGEAEVSKCPAEEWLKAQTHKVASEKSGWIVCVYRRHIATLQRYLYCISDTCDAAEAHGALIYRADALCIPYVGVVLVTQAIVSNWKNRKNLT